MSSVLLINLAENAEAYAAGQSMTHIFCYSPNNAIMNTGGQRRCPGPGHRCADRRQIRSFKGDYTLGRSRTIFNISEPIVYGYPIVLNSYLFIPFIFVLMINTTIFYFLMSTNIIGKMFINVLWVLPSPIQLALATLTGRLRLSGFC